MPAKKCTGKALTELLATPVFELDLSEYPALAARLEKLRVSFSHLLPLVTTTRESLCNHFGFLELEVGSLEEILARRGVHFGMKLSPAQVLAARNMIHLRECEAQRIAHAAAPDPAPSAPTRSAAPT